MLLIKTFFPLLLFITTNNLNYILALDGQPIKGVFNLPNENIVVFFDSPVRKNRIEKIRNGIPLLIEEESVPFPIKDFPFESLYRQGNTLNLFAGQDVKTFDLNTLETTSSTIEQFFPLIPIEFSNTSHVLSAMIIEPTQTLFVIIKRTIDVDKYEYAQVYLDNDNTTEINKSEETESVNQYLSKLYPYNNRIVSYSENRQLMIIQSFIYNFWTLQQFSVQYRGPIDFMASQTIKSTAKRFRLINEWIDQPPEICWDGDVDAAIRLNDDSVIFSRGSYIWTFDDGIPDTGLRMPPAVKLPLSVATRYLDAAFNYNGTHYYIEGNFFHRKSPKGTRVTGSVDQLFPSLSRGTEVDAALVVEDRLILIAQRRYWIYKSNQDGVFTLVRRVNSSFVKGNPIEVGAALEGKVIGQPILVFSGNFYLEIDPQSLEVKSTKLIQGNLFKCPDDFYHFIGGGIIGVNNYKEFAEYQSTFMVGSSGTSPGSGGATRTTTKPNRRPAGAIKATNPLFVVLIVIVFIVILAALIFGVVHYKNRGKKKRETHRLYLEKKASNFETDSTVGLSTEMSTRAFIPQGLDKHKQTTELEESVSGGALKKLAKQNTKK